jgi:hypothetical protein
MNRLTTRLFGSLALLLLAACAGPGSAPAPKPAPAPTVAPKPAAPAQLMAGGYKLQPVYVITFDEQGVPRSSDGQAVTREHVLDLLAGNSIDRKTVIHIEVPKNTDRDQSIEAFERAHQVAKIFDLLGFESVLVALGK